MLHDVDTSQCAEQPLPRGAPDADGMAKETRRNHGFLRLDNLPKGGAGMVHHVHATPRRTSTHNQALHNARTLHAVSFCVGSTAPGAWARTPWSTRTH